LVEGNQPGDFVQGNRLKGNVALSAEL
jgi:hypothetical protein